MPEFSALVAESIAEGYTFLANLEADWQAGVRRFDGTGEIFLGVFSGAELIAVGALTLEPSVADPAVGRLRRIFVRRAWRDRGVGCALVKELLRHAAAPFREVYLRAQNNDAGRLYERFGFRRVEMSFATHHLVLENSARYFVGQQPQ